MKIYSSLFLALTSFVSFSQQSNLVKFAELKQEIRTSKELKDWQNTMIAFQKKNLDFCALKYEQKLNQNLFLFCATPEIGNRHQEFILKLFRTMRIRDELRATIIVKEKVLRTKFPQLVTHFEFDEIFPELYSPIQKAREAYLKIDL